MYTLPCAQPIAPLCDWFTPGAVHLLSTLPRTLISTYRPTKGIDNVNKNFKTLMKVIIAVKKILCKQKKYGCESNYSEGNYDFEFFRTALIICN